MKSKRIITDDIRQRLQGPMVLLEKIAAGRYAPKVFVRAALAELKKADELLNTLKVDF